MRRVHVSKTLTVRKYIAVYSVALFLFYIERPVEILKELRMGPGNLIGLMLPRVVNVEMINATLGLGVSDVIFYSSKTISLVLDESFSGKTT